MHSSGPLTSTIRMLRSEVVLTVRLCINNAVIGVASATTLALSGALHSNDSITSTGVATLKALVIGVLSAYVIEAWSQSTSLAEDKVNKPHRPIPSQLTTPRGLQVRATLASILFVVAALWLQAWLWVLLWPFIAIVQSFWLPLSQYFWWKSVSNFAYLVLLLTTGWTFAAPLSEGSFAWIMIFCVYFTLAFPIEDVRDLEGDRAIGRRTPVMIVGVRAIKAWFAGFMIVFPGVMYFGLTSAAEAGLGTSIALSVILGALSWLCAVRSVMMRTSADARSTYKLFIGIWTLTLCSAPLMFA